jgi:hypothetical protein
MIAYEHSSRYSSNKAAALRRPHLTRVRVTFPQGDKGRATLPKLSRRTGERSSLPLGRRGTRRVREQVCIAESSGAARPKLAGHDDILPYELAVRLRLPALGKRGFRVVIQSRKDADRISVFRPRRSRPSSSLFTSESDTRACPRSGDCADRSSEQ